MKEKILLEDKEYTIENDYVRDYYFYAIIKDSDNNYYFLKQSKNNDEDYINALNKEIEVLLKLKNNKVPKIIHYEKNSYIITNYIDGNILKNFLDIDNRDSILVIISLCRILSELHSIGYVHNDLKTENIIIGKDQKIYLVDFGNATKYDEKPHFGTPNISSPELLCKKQLDQRSDIYSLGVLLHDLIDKKELLDINDNELLREKKNDVIPYIESDISCKKEINDIIFKSANPDINKRYNNVLEMEKDLNNLLERFTI